MGFWETDDVAVTNDGTNIYFYYDASAAKAQAFQDEWQKNFYMLVGNNQYPVTLSGTSGDVTVSVNDKAVGKAVINGNRVEANVPVSDLGLGFDASGQTVSVGNYKVAGNTTVSTVISSDITKNQVADATKETDSSSDSSSSNDSSSSSASSASSTPDVNEDGTSNALDQAVSGDSDSSTETKNADTNNVSGDLGINIDGDFNDWNDKTMTEVHWKGDNDNRELATLLADDKYVYFYVLMEPHLEGGYKTFQPSGYKLHVGDAVYDITLNNGQTVNLANGSTQAVSVTVFDNKKYEKDQNSMDATINNAGEAYVGNTTIDQTAYEYIKDHGNSAVTVQTPSYQWEVRIPLKNLTSSSNETGQDISLTTTTIWTDTLHTSGGSTGPVVLASAGFLIAAITVLKTTGFKLKKRWF